MGTVTELLPDNRRRVELDDGRVVIGYLAGRLKKHHVSVYEGDRVEIVLDPYGGHATNRIIWRK